MNTATITEDKYPSGRPRWKVEATVNGRRIRSYFIDQQKAIAEKERIDRSSAEALQIPQKIVHEAWECHNRLQERGWTLSRATDWVLAHAAAYDDQPPVS